MVQKSGARIEDEERRSHVLLIENVWKISRDKSQYRRTALGARDRPKDGKKRLDGNADGGEKGKAKSN